METLDKKSILEMGQGAFIEIADYGMAKPERPGNIPTHAYHHLEAHAERAENESVR